MLVRILSRGGTMGSIAIQRSGNNDNYCIFYITPLRGACVDSVEGLADELCRLSNTISGIGTWVEDAGTSGGSPRNLESVQRDDLARRLQQDRGKGQVVTRVREGN